MTGVGYVTVRLKPDDAAKACELVMLANSYFRCCDSDPERTAAIKEQYRELAGIEPEVKKFEPV